MSCYEELKGWEAYAHGRHIYVQDKATGEVKNLCSFGAPHHACNFQFSHERECAKMTEDIAKHINEEIAKL